MTTRYAVIGNPVAHSRSPEIHAAFARQTGATVDYTRIEAPLDAFAATARSFFATGGGLSVTVPFKTEALALAKDATQRARLAGAANTLALQADGSLLADNTDGIGLVRDLVLNLGAELAGKRVLLLGAGGAARGVIGPLLAEAPAALFVANRNGDRSASLAAHFGMSGPLDGGGFDEIEGVWDIVINATSAGLHGGEIPLDPECFAADTLAYEMVYGVETPFMASSRAIGASVHDGLGMLVEQAAEQFYLWRGVRPDTVPVIAALRQA
ncbi:MAG: shikimate dehydrogenase [Rhodocyclaceae bacterium]|nr:shikimate dehydrogenase [Rhodocyclaceae bacterium]